MGGTASTNLFWTKTQMFQYLGDEDATKSIKHHVGKFKQKIK